MKPKTIIGIDVGMKTFGVAIYSDQKKFKSSFKTKSFLNFKFVVENFFKAYNPDLIVTCRPTRFGNVIAQHNQLIGVLMLICEDYGTQLVIDTDTECRRILFGKMPRKNAKDYAHQLLGDEFDGDKDAADAWIMAKAYHKKLS